MAPSEFFLDPRVRPGHVATSDLPLFILNCKDRKAEGYANDELLERYNKRLQSMVIGVHLASKLPAVSYLAIRGPPMFAEIVAIDKTVIVISLVFTGGEAGPRSYLIYDAVALSLRMIPQPENPYCSSRVSIARPGRGDDYALVITGVPSDDEDDVDSQDDEDSDADDEDSDADDEDEGDSLFLWRPSSSPPWSEKKSSFPDTLDWSVDKIDTEFSFDGHVYWVDLLCGVSYCSCDALFSDTTKVGGFIHLPPVERMFYSSNTAEPPTYRTMGIVGDSFIRFISIDGFGKKKHTVTVWRLLGHDKGWEKEHELTMKTLCGFKGFGDLPKDLKPMYPLLSTKDTDVVYLMLGKYRGFIPSAIRYHLAIDMGKKIVSSVPQEDWLPRFISCGFNREALVGPCNDKGVLISMKKKKKHRYNGRNVAEAPIPRKKPRLETRI